MSQNNNINNLQTIYLIDTYSLIFKAFFAFSNKPLITSYGFNVSAIYGFLNMLLKILNDFEPVYIVCVHDTGEKSFRNDISQSYKANRPECPNDLKLQFPVIFEFIDAIGIKRFYKSGFEADDIIGTISHKAISNNYYVRIISSDRDFFQLINDKIYVVLTKKGVSEFVEYNDLLVKKEFNILPSQITFYKALVGDTADNIPGVYGIGPKIAQQLINKFKNLDDLYENIEMIQAKFKELLLKDKENAYLSYQLSQIKCDCDIDFDVNFCKINPNLEQFAKLCQQYEQKKMYEKFIKFFEKQNDFFYGNF